ncbi:holin [Microbacterium phage Johann]|uniref:Holin n=2 Tax=Goodmanvirus goodman TaxID=2734238 RepID=A0A3G3LZU8_9CAUD|nr:holin [Microbacterium phage Goodman]AYQ99487.1 holin [Microbacterium phage Goodman]AYQ99655.1 holin [Microbacterium phage Johann]
MIWTKAFWKGAAERAFNAFWQTFAAVLSVVVGGELIPAVGIEGVSWLTALSASAVAAILSLAKSFGNADFTAGTAVTHVEVLSEPSAERRFPE